MLLACVLFSASAQAQETPAEAQARALTGIHVPQPYPDMRALVLDMEKNEKQEELLRRDYTYHVHSEEEELDGGDKVKKATITDAESFTIDGVRVDRVVARNGKPLTPDEAKKENERIDKAVAKARERRAKLEGKGAETTANGDEVITASRFLELGTFSNPRREMLDGRSTMVMDYAGDPHAKTKNAAEAAVRDLVGIIWVDEAGRVMVKAEGRFLNDFKIGGGLVVNVHAGMHFSFRKQHINDEVWLPAEIAGEGKASAMLFFRVHGRVRVVTSDYRKFHTTSNIVGTNGVIGADGQPVPETAPQPDQNAPKPPKI